MKKIILMSLVILVSISVFAQQKLPVKYIITGKVYDKLSNQPLEYTTIVLQPIKTKKITGGITNQKGEFEIEATEGEYNITVEFLSFKPFVIKNKKIESNTNLGTIFLTENSESLREVEVIAEKSTVEVRLDKKIYNVGKDMTVKGGNAADVLDNVPSVSVDVEGTVSLRGSENVRILIDGKPSGLVGLSSTDALKQLPADAIQKVEVITSPSARYDAEGTAGIINIILRKGKNLGYNASINTTVGYPDNLGFSTNQNYRGKKVNLFSNLGYNYSDAPGKALTNTEYLTNGITSSFLEEVRKYNRNRNSFNTNAGIEFFIDDKSSITTSFVYRTSKGDTDINNFTDYFNATKILTSQNERVELQNEDENTLEFSVNYTKNFKKDGHKLTIDLQTQNSNEDSGSQISDHYVNPTTIPDKYDRTSTDESQKSYLAKLDYVLPIGENSQFEFGYKSNFSTDNTDYLVEYKDNGIWINDINFSNDLVLKENVHALYSQYGSKKGKFSYLFGLRWEMSDTNIDLKTSNEHYTKNESGFYPTANFSYELKEDQSLTFGYSKRLRRPHGRQLNPFKSKSSETSIFVGNIDLNPTYSDAFDIGYLKRWEKVTLNSSFYYQHTTGNYEMITEESGDTYNGLPILIRTFINLSINDRYGYELTASYNPLEWLKLNGSFNMFQSITEGDYNGRSYDSKDVNTISRFSSRITLPKKIDFQTTLMYRGPQEGAFSSSKGMFSANVAFSKEVMKDNGTLSFNISDVFNTRKRQMNSVTDRTITYSEFQWRQRQFMLNFTYRLNQKKKPQRPQNGGGGEEEIMF
ncbi:MAG: outer membrane beta-barrel family protein [Flavobacteriaceae bacterium]|nr:outer membrane beta-barrel family protein [Flavobacteriaceae bacterium]